MSWVPTMLERVLAARGGRRAPRSLRCVLLGGGPAPRGLIERARSQGFPIAATYGLTEASSQVATQLPTLAESRALRACVRSSGPKLDTIDDDGKSVRGRPGEILVRGPAVMEGYWNRPEESERALRGGWLHTGDIGVLDASGRARGSGATLRSHHLWRREHLSSEIESRSARTPAVIEAAVGGPCGCGLRPPSDRVAGCCSRATVGSGGSPPLLRGSPRGLQDSRGIHGRR